MNDTKRFLIEVKGLVEGVGFRPFVYRVAKKLGLGGWVKNDTKGVLIEVEGKESKIEEFLNTIKTLHPKASEILSIHISEIPSLGEKEFSILQSVKSKEKFPIIPPDIGICDKCREELLNRSDRRFLYPFINCTDCGPRFSIVEDVPYDRNNTSMKEFEMCPTCKEEYENIRSRRFHAQPIACFTCGPNISLLDANQSRVIERQDFSENGLRDYTRKTIIETSRLIFQGNIIALKGIGGFQLVCRADIDDVVRKLRTRKRREEKPFAVMFRRIKDIEDYCYISPKEREILSSYIAPIVLLRKKKNTKISELVAPRNPFLGCMLPYSPLHVLLMEEVKIPLVCTSGNISDEPICIDNDEALQRLMGIADYFLIHDRKIVRHVDDSVIRITPSGNSLLLRRARGFVPRPITLSRKLPNILAVGGHLKNTVAVSTDNYVILSQHIGDLETLESVKAFERSVNDLLRFYEIKPRYIVCDLHPDYYSTQFAEALSEKLEVPLLKVQHHLAHILSVTAENDSLGEKVIGVGWDGTGYGMDGEMWGSEFFLVSDGKFERVFHFLPIPLVGGEKAIREVYRIGIALLLLSSQLDEAERIFGNRSNFNQIVSMYKKGMYVKSCGAGRLFDGVSSILGISEHSNFEGQSAMELEFALYSSRESNVGEYEYEINGKTVDWRNIVIGIVKDLKDGVPRETISLKFHNTMVKIIEDCVSKIAKFSLCNKVALSGGVFQNSYILDTVIRRLEESGFSVMVNRKVPPNDGGISLGQVVYPLFISHRT
ncbi:MAG: carbamoyltransferase HypF [Brevinematia bacterium]